MMAAAHSPGFIEALPPLRGRLQADAPLAPFTWFRAGGAAEVLIRPADANDLAGFLAALSHDVPVYVIGACSNLIVREVSEFPRKANGKMDYERLGPGA